uniref:Tachykinin n=1 Tax=Parastrongyloides trichosuri TaxID=131310 RepID=A0A0N4ZDC0_PARTI
MVYFYYILFTLSTFGFVNCQRKTAAPSRFLIGGVPTLKPTITTTKKPKLVSSDPFSLAELEEIASEIEEQNKRNKYTRAPYSSGALNPRMWLEDNEKLPDFDLADALDDAPKKPEPNGYRTSYGGYGSMGARGHTGPVVSRFYGLGSARPMSNKQTGSLIFFF